MAEKNAKKPKGKKKSASNESKEKKTVLKKAEAKVNIPKIKAIVKDGLNEKLTYVAILENILKHHPESKFNKKHLSWYKNKLGLNKS